MQTNTPTSADCSVDNHDRDINNKEGKSIPPERVFLAPMVRGSALAFRQLVRNYGVKVCYSPMLRATEVVKGWKNFKRDNDIKGDSKNTDFNEHEKRKLHEDAWMLLHDILPDKHPLVVQLCGSDPEALAAAVKVLLELNDKNGCHIEGIDLNLGCPQSCAKEGGFGAFLVEYHPSKALECVAAMRQAIDEFAVQNPSDMRQKPRLSCKIRLQQDQQHTIQFCQDLVRVGCRLVAVHCRKRTDKHDGPPNLQAAVEIAQKLHPVPVVINGWRWKDANQALVETNAYGIMLARDFLKNPRLLTSRRDDPGMMAAEYLEFARMYSPPSELYLKLHMRWVFREALEPEDKYDPATYAGNNWRPRLWSFLARPYLTTLEQFRQVVFMYFLFGCVSATTGGEESHEVLQTKLRKALPKSLLYLADYHCSCEGPITFHSIRYYERIHRHG